MIYQNTHKFGLNVLNPPPPPNPPKYLSVNNTLIDPRNYVIIPALWADISFSSINNITSTVCNKWMKKFLFAYLFIVNGSYSMINVHVRMK